MKINDWILQNENFAIAMKSYLNEINKLELFRDLLRQKLYSKKDYPYIVQRSLKKEIEKERDLFEWLNDTYNGEASNSPVILENGGAGFIREARGGIDRIQMIWSRYRKSSNQIVRNAVITVSKA